MDFTAGDPRALLLPVEDCLWPRNNFPAALCSSLISLILILKSHDFVFCFFTFVVYHVFDVFFDFSMML